jgi:3-dehydroquinate synthase
MTSIFIKTGKRYKVRIDDGLLAHAGELAAEAIRPCTLVLVADDRVDALYGDTAAESFSRAGFRVLRYTFPNGEASKNMVTLGRLLEFLGEHAVTRSDLIAALGGGVTGDLAGFAAAVYLRGIRYLQIPTTFLAAVDSSVGGKTAVDLAAGKNLAGAFCQPEMVLCDPQVFSTLTPEIFSDGVAEGIKYGMIADADLFQDFSSGEYRTKLEQTVARCVAIKGDVVARDEFDTGDRQLLNFGHTFGHAIELCSHFSVTHGHAVAIGMVIASRAAERRGICSTGCTASLLQALEACGLPVRCEFPADALFAAALADKKRAGDTITLILPQEIGRCIRHPIPVEELRGYLRDGLEAV